MVFVEKELADYCSPHDDGLTWHILRRAEMDKVVSML